MVLNTYRQANLAVRPIDPPQYFSITPSVTETYDSESGEEYTNLANHITEKIEELKLAYIATLTQRHTAVTNEAKAIQGNQYNEYISTINTDAMDLIRSNHILMPVQKLTITSNINK